MNKLSLFLFGIIVLFSCNTKQRGIKYESLIFTSDDSIPIEGRLWFPAQNNSNLLVIKVAPCLVTTIPPDSSIEERYDLLLRKQLIGRGSFYFEFAGRKDSVMKYGSNYPTSTIYTKAEDVENAIKYIKSRKEFKDKEIILLGQSDGGMTSAVVASRNDVKGLVLISTPAVNGFEFTEYQALCQDSLFMGTFGSHPNAFELLNDLSSLDQKFDRSVEGFHRFRKNNYGPLKYIMLRYENYDTIAARITEYLNYNWNREDSVTKRLHSNDFANYCRAYKHFAYIQPEQVALYKWNPHLYFSKIKCPVLAVFGERDRKFEYSSSLLNMKNMLMQGGNSSFTPFVLKGHDHYLANDKKQVNMEVIEIILNWTMEVE